MYTLLPINPIIFRTSVGTAQGYLLGFPINSEAVSQRPLLIPREDRDILCLSFLYPEIADYKRATI